MAEKQNPTVRIVTATEAQNKFGTLLKRAYASAEHLIIERDGIPVAALIPIADYQQFAPHTSETRVTQRVAVASQRDQALRDLSVFLERVHARLPDVDENEANRLIDQTVREVRHTRARQRKGSRRK